MVETFDQPQQYQNLLTKPGGARVELRKRKTPFTKTYKDPTGIFHTEVSDVQMSYRNRSGNWRDIDNQLLPQSENGYDYVNKANSFKVRFARNNQQGKLVYIEFDSNHWIAFSPSDSFTQSSTPTSTSILYSGAKKGVNLQYILDGNKLKERIIFNSPPASNVFSFDLTYQGLSFIRQQDGSINAVDAQTGAGFFSFKKPNAIDSADKSTVNTSVDITNSMLSGRIIITIDADWLKNASYPVIVDPAVLVDTSVNVTSNIIDTFVSSSNPNTSYMGDFYLRVGSFADLGVCRTLIKFRELPSIPPGAKITGATLLLPAADGNAIPINAYNIISDWNDLWVIWNTMPSIDIANPLALNHMEQLYTDWKIDITSLVSDWYSGKRANYGIMLQAASDASPGITFSSTENTTEGNAHLIINYTVDELGTEPYYVFHGNTNISNGNLVLNYTDVTLPGRGIPITITRTYNLRSDEVTAVGKRWRSNTMMRLNTINKEIVQLVDGDGTTKTYLRVADDNYRAPVGVYDKLTFKDDIYTLEEKSGVKYNFTIDGLLKEIVDKNKTNITSFSYQDSRLDTIRDASGRYVSFGYDNGKLKSITGNEITGVYYDYNGDEMVSVSRKDSSGNILNKTVYSYDDTTNSMTITDYKGNTTTLTYFNTPELGRQVKSIQNTLTVENTTTHVLEPKTATTLFDYYKPTASVLATITDPKGQITEYSLSNLINDPNVTVMKEVTIAMDKTGSNVKTVFGWDEQYNLRAVIDPNGIISIQPGTIQGYATIFTYDPVGQITDITNKNNDKITFKYNVESGIGDVSEITDPDNRISKNGYDPETRNLITSSNPLSSTVVYGRDQYGNIVTETDPIGLGHNLILNSGFEVWDSGLPVYWSRYSSAGTISYDATQKVSGSGSLKLTSPGNLANQRAVLISSMIGIGELLKYNLSWYAKTTNAGQDLGGASVDIYWFDKNKTMLSSQTMPQNAPTIGTTDTFIRKGVRVNAPSGASYIAVALALSGGANNTAATAWFDNIQLEYGTVINQTNLVYNSSFELDVNDNDLPDGWDATRLKAGDVLDTWKKHSGSRSMLMIGTAASKDFSQNIKLEGSDGIPLYFSGWSLFEGASTSPGSIRLTLQLNYTDGTTDTSSVEFSKSASGWDFKEAVFTSKKAFKSLKISAFIENISGEVNFDDIVVRLNGAANALISSYNISQNSSFEYYDTTTNWPVEWVIFKAGTTGTYNINYAENWTMKPNASGKEETVQPISGTRMIRMGSVPDWALIANSTTEPLVAGKTFMLSAAIKTDGVTGSGAIIKFDILDVNNNYLGQKYSDALKGTNNWTRVAISLSEAEAKTISPNAVKVKAAVGTLGVTAGNMFFDAVRYTDGNQITSYGFDPNSNYITKVTNPKGNKLDIKNDTRGNVTQITDSLSYVYKFGYDKLDNIISSENPKGLKSYYHYDNNNNLTQVDNHGASPINTSFVIEYNELQLPKVIGDPLGRTTGLSYDINANLIYVKFPNANQISYMYDTLDRVTKKAYTGDSTQWDYEYDLNSNVQKVKKNTTEVTSYEYDKLDRLTKITYPPVNAVTNYSEYAYDPSDLLLNIKNSILPSGDQLVRYEYDNAGNNVNIYGPKSTTTAFMYDEESKLVKSYSQITGNSTSSYREYDENGKITRIRTENKTGTVIFDTSYTYDATGNRLKEINKLSGKRAEYKYDSINQLIEESYYDTLIATVPVRKITYDYDLLGNKKTRTELNVGTTTYDYNAANEITNVNGTPTYTFDRNGNMITSGNFTFVYNAENQLVRILQSGVEKARYEYDWRGLRTKKVTPTKTELYYYNGDSLAYITDQNNNLKYYFVRDLNDRLLQMIDYTAATPKAYIYVIDVHGNIVALVNDTGNRILNYEYNAWGQLTNTPETNVTTGNGELLRDANPFRYCGYQYDPEMGLYYLKARYYTPGLGRFLTRDIELSNNMYVYAGNNPVNLVDASGKVVEADMDGGGVSRPKIDYLGGAAISDYNRRVTKNKSSKKSKSSNNHGNTFQLGLNINAGYIGGADIFMGVVISSSSSVPFDIGPIISVGAGLQSPAVSASIQGVYTKASSISSLRGAGVSEGASYGEFITGGIEYVYGQGYEGVGGSIGIGGYAPLPTEFHLYKTYSFVGSAVESINNLKEIFSQ